MSGRRRALVVAIDSYDHPGLRRLPSAAADADALATVLADPAVGDFEVEVIRNEPAHEVQARIEDLFADARADDVLLLHFSGHGLKSDRGELFFAARTTRPDRLASTAVPAGFVQRCLAATPSRSVVLLLDCCYGGAFGQGVVVRAAGDVNLVDSFPTGRSGGGRGRAVISASNAIEYAFEGDQLLPDAHPRPSPFTAALVQGLRTGEADRDEDGWVALGELYDYVFDQVRAENPRQTPTRDIEMQGELFLARSNRRRIRPAPLPGDLQAALADANPYTRLGAVAELRARLGSDNAAVAAGAREALTQVAAGDTRMVAEAAAQALREAEPMAPAEPVAPVQAVERARAAAARPATVPLDQPPAPAGHRFDPLIAWLAIVTGVALGVLVVIEAVTTGEAVRGLSVVHPVVLVVGGVLVLRGARRLLGLGLLAAAGAAATVPAVVLASGGLAAAAADDPIVVPVTLAFCAVLPAVAVGALAARAAAAGGARLTTAGLRSLPAVVTVAAGLAGSAALAMSALRYAANSYDKWDWLVAPSWWFTVPALLVPLLAVRATPVPLRQGLLIGWVAGAAGVQAVFFPILTSAELDFSYRWLILFTASLPFVLVGLLNGRRPAT